MDAGARGFTDSQILYWIWGLCAVEIVFHTLALKDKEVIKVVHGY